MLLVLCLRNSSISFLKISACRNNKEASEISSDHYLYCIRPNAILELNRNSSAILFSALNSNIISQGKFNILCIRKQFTFFNPLFFLSGLTLNRSQTYFLLAILVQSLGDFLTRFDIARDVTTAFSWGDSSWALSWSTFAALLFFSKTAVLFQRVEKTTVSSLRAFSSGTVFLANVIMLLVSIFVYFHFNGANSFQLTLTLLVVYLVYVISTEIGLRISSLFQSISDDLPIPSTLTDIDGSLHLRLKEIHRKSPFSEVNELIGNYNQLSKKTNRLTELYAESKALAAISETAAQVSHDIRSPLSALEMVAQGTDAMDEETRILVRNSVTRIRDIANNLLSSARSKQISSKSNLNGNKK